MRGLNYLKLVTIWYFVSASNVTGKESVFLVKKTSDVRESDQPSKKNVVFSNFPRVLGLPPSWTRTVPSFQDYISQLRQEYLNLKDKFTSQTLSSDKEHSPNDSFATRSDTEPNKDNGSPKNSASKEPNDSEHTTSTFAPSPTQGYIYSGTGDRFNYASVDCAAGIMETNKGARSASAILHKDKDRYLLDTCSSKRYVIIELCQEIEIQTLLMSNFEFFSSTFRHFNIYTSSRYPPKETDGWYLAGTYEALNTRSVQAFDVHLPKVWIKYLKIEFLSHYGDEYYCPVSQIKVFGPTMLVEYLDSQDLPSEEDQSKVEHLAAITKLEDIYREPTLGEISDNSGQKIELELPSPPAPLSVAEFSHEPNVSSIPKKLLDLRQCKPKLKPTIVYPYSKLQMGVCRNPTITDNLTSLLLPQTPRVINPPPEFIGPKPSTMPKVEPTSTQSTSEGFESVSTEPLHDTSFSNDFIPPHTSQTLQTPGPGSGSGSENVFRTMARRLNALETKYTLIENYVNEQSAALNSIFAKLDAHQQQYLQAVLKEFSRNTWNQLDGIKRAQDEVWGMLFHKMESTNSKLRSEQFSLNHKVNLLAEEVVFGKRLALAQLSILFIVVVMVVLVQLYYSAFNSKPYDTSELTGLSELSSHRPLTSMPFSSVQPPSRRPSALTRQHGTPHLTTDSTVPPEFIRVMLNKESSQNSFHNSHPKLEKPTGLEINPTPIFVKPEVESPRNTTDPRQDNLKPHEANILFGLKKGEPTTLDTGNLLFGLKKDLNISDVNNPPLNLKKDLNTWDINGTLSNLKKDPHVLDGNDSLFSLKKDPNTRDINNPLSDLTKDPDTTDPHHPLSSSTLFGPPLTNPGEPKSSSSENSDHKHGSETDPSDSDPIVSDPPPPIPSTKDDLGRVKLSSYMPPTPPNSNPTIPLAHNFPVDLEEEDLKK